MVKAIFFLFFVKGEFPGMYIEPSSPERVLQRKNNEDIIKEVQIKTTMSYHLAAVGMMTHAEDV